MEKIFEKMLNIMPMGMWLATVSFLFSLLSIRSFIVSAEKWNAIAETTGSVIDKEIAIGEGETSFFLLIMLIVSSIYIVRWLWKNSQEKLEQEENKC